MQGQPSLRLWLLLGSLSFSQMPPLFPSDGRELMRNLSFRGGEENYRLLVILPPPTYFPGPPKYRAPLSAPGGREPSPRQSQRAWVTAQGGLVLQRLIRGSRATADPKSGAQMPERGADLAKVTQSDPSFLTGAGADQRGFAAHSPLHAPLLLRLSVSP